MLPFNPTVEKPLHRSLVWEEREEVEPTAQSCVDQSNGAISSVHRPDKPEILRKLGKLYRWLQLIGHDGQ